MVVVGVEEEEAEAGQDPVKRPGGGRSRRASSWGGGGSPSENHFAPGPPPLCLAGTWSRWGSPEAPRGPRRPPLQSGQPGPGGARRALLRLIPPRPGAGEPPARWCPAPARPAPCHVGGSRSSHRQASPGTHAPLEQQVFARARPHTSTAARTAVTPASQRFRVGSERCHVITHQDTQGREGRTRPHRHHVSLGGPSSRVGGVGPWGRAVGAPMNRLRSGLMLGTRHQAAAGNLSCFPEKLNLRPSERRPALGTGSEVTGPPHAGVRGLLFPDRPRPGPADALSAHPASAAQSPRTERPARAPPSPAGEPRRRHQPPEGREGVSGAAGSPPWS